MAVSTGEISIIRRGDSIGVGYAGREFVQELGIGLPIDDTWRWTFDGSLKPLAHREGNGRDSLGEYACETLLYAIPGVFRDDVPVIQQDLKIYDNSTGGAGRLLVETRVLEEIRGTHLEDSFYATTFNSPVLLFQRDLNFLAYTWGLMGAESSREGGHFPEAVTAKGLDNIPAKLRSAGFSAREDLRTISEKPFGPLVLYDDEESTLVISPLNHFLISPLRIIDTPSGTGVARGLHGSVDRLGPGTNTRTALVFGEGVVETMLRWGDWLLESGGKRRAPSDNPLLGNIGFWNCFGGYYTELFRQVDEGVLIELAAYFQREGIPIGYFGLDLWYNYGQVGFAKNYSPDAMKYPRGLEPVHRETGLPYLLHMSAFESPNDYMGRHEFGVDESSSYPMERDFYDELATDFKKSGAFGIWPDFLRTQLQNSKSLRNRIGNADQWFDDLAGAFGDQDMAMMMCMPTIGHYLASARHRNIVAVRTHSDYMNHQETQVETLRAAGQVRNSLPFQESIRHNVLLSLLANALGLSPSYDVFLTNRAHPEGFGERNAQSEALLRAMSAGVIAVGDKVGLIDKEIINKLCFPDGRIPRPDHPPLPVVSTLQSSVLAFYTTTTVGTSRWVYLAVFNIGDEEVHYDLDVRELAGIPEPVIYDYFAGKVLSSSVLAGGLEPARGHYYVIMPRIGGAYFLGFQDKYITVSSRQVSSIKGEGREATINFRLPLPSQRDIETIGSAWPSAISTSKTTDASPPSEIVYTVAVYTPAPLQVCARGADIRRVGPGHGLLPIEFVAKTEEPSLSFSLAEH